MNRISIESFVVAFGVSISLTPLIRYFSIRLGLFDPPGPLKIHRHPVPRLGGIAIAIAIAVGCLLTKSLPLGATRVFLTSLALVWLAGFIDDLRGLSPLIRMAAQTAAGLLLWWGGWHFPAIKNDVGNAVAICALVILFTNAFNWLDGSDGLAAGIAGTIALLFAVAQPQAAWHLRSQIGTGVACALLGAAAGFLVFNFPAPRASIFMGDSGSTTLGFTIVVLSLNFSDAADNAVPSLLFPLLIAGLPLGDAALSFVRRARLRQSPLKGDRQHFYDIALKRGWSPPKVALVSYVVTALLGGIGWIGLRLPLRHFLILTSLAFAILFAIALCLGSLGQDWTLASFAAVTPRKPSVAEEGIISALPRLATTAAVDEAELTMSDSIG